MSELQKFLKDELDPTSQAIAILSGAGGPFGYWATRIEQKRSQIQQESLLRLIAELQDQQAKLEARIDLEGVAPEEFYEMFQLTVTATTRTTRDEKIKTFARLLANLLLKRDDGQKLNYTQLDHFVRCVDSLTVDALWLLGVCSQIVAAKRGRAVHPDTDFSISELAERVENANPDLVMGLVSQLEAWNLVYKLGVPGVAQFQGGWMTNQRVRLTSLGIRLLEFVSGVPATTLKSGGR